MRDLAGCCPFQDAIDLVSRRYALTIIWLLEREGPCRFNELKKSLDVNPVTLTQRLNELEQAGVLSRTAYKETPPRVEYNLTARGRDLVPLLDQLGEWAKTHDIAAQTV